MSTAAHKMMALLGLSGALFFSVGLASAGVVQITSPGATDYFLWSQLGGDQTLVPNSPAPILTSLNGYLASVGLAGDDSILEAVCPAGAGPSAPCSYQTQSSGFAPNDIVLVTSTVDDSTGTGGNGPLMLSFSTGLPSIGAYIQQDVSTGTFEAELMVYDDATLVGDFTATSDAAGDPVFLGASDPTSNITGATFSLDSCGEALGGGVSTSCSTADFAIDTLFVGTPEPSSASMMVGAFLLAALIGFSRRRGKGVFAAGSAIALLGAAGAPRASAQTADTVIRNLPRPRQNRAIVKALIPTPEEEASAEALKPRAAAPTLPLWNYTIQSPLDGKTYPGTMVGSNPFVRGARPSTLSVVVVPLIITMTDSGEVFDPTNGLPSQCIFNSEPPGTPLGLVQNSPIFEPEAFTMNGQNIGTYQYIDAFQRANFWSYTSLTGSGYHNTLSPTYGAAMNLTIPVANGKTYDASNSGGCGKYALIDINYFDAQLKTLIGNLGAAANPSKFVLFLTFNSFVGDTGMPEDQEGEVNVPAGCCVFGYHTANTPIAGHNTQTYGFAAWDATNIFPGSEDVSVLAHEVGEWLDDPYVDNLVPPWGNIGQVTGSCYAFLEVGDPLTGVNFPPFTNQGSGYVYHMQELAYYSWFYRQSPSIGAGGAYSNNGTLGSSGAGQLCATPFVFTDIAGNATGPVEQGTQFDLIGAATTVARTQQIAPVVAPTGTFNILDNSNDDLLCSNVALTALAAPNDNASSGTCGPFNTAGNPWSVGTHQLIIQYNATGNWTGGSFTLNLEITAPPPPE